MLEGFAVACSSHSISNCLSLQFSPQVCLFLFFFSNGQSFIPVYFYLLLTLCPSFCVSSAFPRFESCPVKHPVLSLWWYRCCSRGLVAFHILHDPVSTFVFIWQTQTLWTTMAHPPLVVSCQESPVNKANVSSSQHHYSLVCFSNQIVLQWPHHSARKLLIYHFGWFRHITH